MRLHTGEPLTGGLPLAFLGLMAMALGALSAWWLLVRLDNWPLGGWPRPAELASATPAATPAPAATPSALAVPPRTPLAVYVPMAPHSAPPAPDRTLTPPAPAPTAAPESATSPTLAPWPAAALPTPEPPTPAPATPEATPTPEPPLPTPTPHPPSPTPTPLPRGIVSSDFGGNIVVRAAPSTSARQVGTIPSGSEVVILGRTTGEAVTPGNTVWYLVQYRGVQGYVYSSLVTLRR